MSECRYARAPWVVWRLADDRVLVRRVGGAGPAAADSVDSVESADDAAADLFGPAAMVWVALDEARTLDEVTTEVAAVVGSSAADGPRLEQALTELVAQGLVVEVSA